MNAVLSRLPLTRLRIAVAGILYRLVHLVYRNDHRVVTRRGIIYELDLREGIDFAVFVSGNFQGHVSDSKHLGLGPDAVVIDVGANCGVVTLQYAKAAPAGKVFAFEPTTYAFTKLQRNLELNPELAKNIVATQLFVSDSTDATDLEAYASWRVSGGSGEPTHRVHGGTTKPTEGIGAVTLDAFCVERGLDRLDLIKIDTDGHELEVLRGAREVLRTYRPVVVFEIGLYLLADRNVDFRDYLRLFDALDYRVFDITGRHELDASNFTAHLPQQSTVDLLARPQ